MLHYLAEVQEKSNCFLVSTTGGEEDQEMKNCVVLVTRVRFAPLFCSDRDEEKEAREGWGSGLPAGRVAPNMLNSHTTVGGRGACYELRDKLIRMRGIAVAHSIR